MRDRPAREASPAMNDAARMYRRNMLEYAELYGDDLASVVEVTDADLQQDATEEKGGDRRSRVYRRKAIEQAELFGGEWK